VRGLQDKVVVVTGAGRGMGQAMAERLAAEGARVAVTDVDRESALSTAAALDGAAGFRLDITDAAEVSARIEEIVAALGPIDALVNNAGLVVSPRQRQVTADGLELMVGGNAFGHFALTAQLFPALAPEGRVVWPGSMATRMTRVDPADLLSEKRYRPFRAYAFSKHAVHGFAFELDRRLRAAGDSRRSLLAHPGFAVTGLAARRPGVTDQAAWRRLTEIVLFSVVGQGKDDGAWSAVRAVADPDAESGTFFGPSRMFLLTGPPAPMAPVVSSASPEFGATVWALAEEKTGVRFAVPPVE
jgi:NAD(P)-dependent dehydrogenase (short-subunit alcohol dehydrogenase family)